MIRIKNKAALTQAVLGRHYNLSLAWISRGESRRLNRLYRDQDRATNVLSFPLDDNNGEILLTEAIIKEEARQLNRSTAEHTARLFIHGVLHLKGYRHGSKMEATEQQLFRRFFLHGQNYRHRSRHRHFQHPAGGVRTNKRQQNPPRPGPS